MNSISILLLIALCLIVAYFIVRKFKMLKISNVYFVDGSVKVGKTYISVALAVKTYKRNLRKFYLTYPLLRLKLLLQHKEYNEKVYKPMLFSNIPLRFVRFNIFTKDMLLRQVRIPNKSVVLLDEVSLIADSMLYKDEKINNELLLFYKLFGHYSHGGTLIANSQTISDNHFSLKRSIGRYLYVYNRTKFPLFTIVKGIERVYTDDTSTINAEIGDVENNTRKMLFLNRYYKMYDCYCYSIFTDDLTIYCDYEQPILNRHDSLKCDNLVSLQGFSQYLDKRNKENTTNV